MPLQTTDLSNKIKDIQIFLNQCIKYNKLMYLIVDSKKDLEIIISKYKHSNLYYTCIHDDKLEIFLSDYSDSIKLFVADNSHFDGYFTNDISRILNNWLTNNSFLEIINAKIDDELNLDPTNTPKLTQSLAPLQSLEKEVILMYLLQSIQANLQRD